MGARARVSAVLVIGAGLVGIPALVLCLVGDGPLHGVVSERIRALGLEGHVRLVPATAQEQLPRWYQAADVFVFDPATIDLEKPQQVHDLPEGAPRFVQRAKGIHYTIVNGKLSMQAGAHTGNCSGKVLRS